MFLSTKEGKERMSRILYASTVGSLKYAMPYAQPNIFFAVSDFQVDKDERKSAIFLEECKTILHYKLYHRGRVCSNVRSI